MSRAFIAKSLSTIVPCIAILIMLVGCKSSQTTQIPSLTKVPNMDDGGLLSARNSCTPPCFWDIFPGKSTQVDVERILQSKAVLSKCEAFDNESQGGTRRMSCEPGLSIVYQKGSDVVDGIGIRPTQIINVADVINHYGNPDAVLVVLTGTPDKSPKTTMMLYYDKILTTLVLDEQVGVYYDVQPTTSIFNIGYDDAASYKAAKQDSATWKGYGKYEQTIH